MSDMCNDNRFELVAKYKAKLIESTNIDTSADEMAVIDNILFRMWQIGWLDRLEHGERNISECMTQEDAECMDASQAVQILKPLRDMMRDQWGCPISDAYFALGKAIEALERSEYGTD